MKKTLMLLLLTKGAITLNAQTKTDTGLIKKQVAPIIKVPAQQTTTKPVTLTPPPAKTTATGIIYTPPAQTNTPPPNTTQAIDDSKYFLTNAKVTINTGNDNKELSSNCIISLRPNESSANFFEFAPVMTLNNFEFAVNSSNEIKLEYRKVYTDIVNPAKNSLQFYKQWGVNLTIYYSSNYTLDAWKINGISVSLEFKDANGNPYPDPTYANVKMGIQVPVLMGFKVGNDPFSSKDNICDVSFISTGLGSFNVNSIKTFKCPK